jgi:hypothetical protein
LGDPEYRPVRRDRRTIRPARLPAWLPFVTAFFYGGFIKRCCHDFDSSESREHCGKLAHAIIVSH